MVVMVVTPEVADVLFVVEATANCGAYLNEFILTYIVPTLEYFNGGPDHEHDCGSERNSSLYALVIFRAADSLSSVDCCGPFTSINKMVSLLDKIEFIGGHGESQSHIAEGLGTALHCLEDLQAKREKNLQVEKHCILLCNSTPYQLPVQDSPNYVGLTIDQLCGLIEERNINLSILSPRKIPALLKLFDKSGGDLQVLQTKNFAKDARHLVLLKGFCLEERPVSPMSVSSGAASSPLQPGGSPIPQTSRQNGTASYTQPFPGTLPTSTPGFPADSQQFPNTRPAAAPNLATLVNQPVATATNINRAQWPTINSQQPGLITNQQFRPTTAPLTDPATAAPVNSSQRVPSKCIWEGILEWHEKMKQAPESRVVRQVHCKVSCTVENGEPVIKSESWPNKLLMQLVPRQLMTSFGSQYFTNSRSVVFYLTPCDALDSLTKVMSTGFAGCVHFTSPQATTSCDIRVLMLLFSADKQTFIGFIPTDQPGFVNRMRRVIQDQKHRQEQQQQQQQLNMMQSGITAPVRMSQAAPRGLQHVIGQPTPQLRQILQQTQLQQQQQQQQQHFQEQHQTLLGMGRPQLQGQPQIQGQSQLQTQLQMPRQPSQLQAQLQGQLPGQLAGSQMQPQLQTQLQAGTTQLQSQLQAQRIPCRKYDDTLMDLLHN